jgi:hypothetical protein
MNNYPENGPLHLLWPVSDRATSFHARAGTVGDRPERGGDILIRRGAAPGMNNCPENDADVSLPRPFGFPKTRRVYTHQYIATAR